MSIYAIYMGGSIPQKRLLHDEKDGVTVEEFLDRARNMIKNAIPKELDCMNIMKGLDIRHWLTALTSIPTEPSKYAEEYFRAGGK